jgi:predicted MFS family arabinose efflux permease
MYAVVGVGTGLGPVLARRMTRDRAGRLRPALMASFFATAAGLALVAPTLSFALVLVGSFIRGLGSGVNWVLSTQVLLLEVPGIVRGRVFSVEFALFTLATAISSAGAGWLLDRGLVSVQSLLIIMAAASVLPGLAWAGGLAFSQSGRRPSTDENEPMPEAFASSGSDPVSLEGPSRGHN